MITSYTAPVGFAVAKEQQRLCERMKLQNVCV